MCLRLLRQSEFETPIYLRTKQKTNLKPSAAGSSWTGGARKYGRFLMHDIKSYTRDALIEIIEYGKNNGYTFDKLDEHNEMVTQKVNN